MITETLFLNFYYQFSGYLFDFIVPVEIDGIVHQVYVLKRPPVNKRTPKINT